MKDTLQKYNMKLAEGVFAVYDSNAATHEPAGLALATSGG